jgi:DNA-binding NtrC family response regulator
MTAKAFRQRRKQLMTSDDKVNILLVDDQPAKLLSYETILSGLGENLIKAASAREALEQLLKQDIAVVRSSALSEDRDHLHFRHSSHRRRPPAGL